MNDETITLPPGDVGQPPSGWCPLLCDCGQPCREFAHHRGPCECGPWNEER